LPSFDSLSRGVEPMGEVIERHAPFGIVPPWGISTGPTAIVTGSPRRRLRSVRRLPGQSGDARSLLLRKHRNLCGSSAIDQERDCVHFVYVILECSM
jgi:hypothetical protein